MEKHTNPRQANILSRPARLLLAIIVALAMSAAAAPSAHADVRKGDVVMGQTMSERGLKATQCPSVESEYAYLIDKDGTVYFERNADQEVQIASITKIMTAIVALQTAPLDTEITVSSNAAAAGESSAGLWAGDKLSLEDALKGLMVPSGNDAAVAIGECIGKIIYENSQASGTTLTDPSGQEITGQDDAAYLAAFVSQMNAKAEEIGCTNTVFENPHGLDFGRFSGNLHSTAKEVSKIAAFAMQDDFFRSIVELPEATLKVNRNGNIIDVVVKSTDELIGQYEGACGIKTGNTDLAGPCFAGACDRDGRMLYAIVLHSTSEQQRFSDATTLYDWVYDNYVMYELAHSDVTATMATDDGDREVPVVAEVALDSWLDKTVPATFSDPNAAIEVFAPLGNISQSFEFYNVSGSVKAGDVVGKATFYQRNEVIGNIDLVACENVDAPDILESVGIWWDKFTRSLSGQPTSAQSVIINDCELIIDKS